MSAILTAAKQRKEKDWKEKYYQSLDDLDEKRKQWEKDETNLTKSILKLAFSYTGLNDELDLKLKELGETLRKNKDSNQRRKVIEGVVDSIIKQTDDLDKHQKQPPDQASPILTMLTRLNLNDKYQFEINQIKKKLGENSEQQNIETSLQNLADIVNELSEEAKTATEKPEPGYIEVKSVDNFTEFLNRLSLPGETGSELLQLRKRVKLIEEEKQQLELVDETVQLLIKAYKTSGDEQSDGAPEAQTNINEILLQLIEWLSFPADFKQQIDAIKEKLAKPVSDKDMSRSLREVSNIICAVNNKLQNELDEIETYLTNVINRLKELELNLLKTEKARTTSYEEIKSLNSRVKDDVKQLQNDVENSNDIEQIKSSLDSHLNFIQSNLDNHLQSEQERHKESELRVKKLSLRVNEMETETLKLKRNLQTERKKAYKDVLTGLPNRLAYEEKMHEEFSRKQRYDNPLCLAVIDIDKFKNVNDTYGHKAGDKVLKTVADLCIQHIRNIDFIARYGGEEFVLLFPETGLDEALAAAEHLRKEVDKCNFHYNKKDVPVTISMGLAEFGKKDSPDEVFKRADKALYAAKESGRNRCLSEKDLEY